jgi:hypothetical protein
MTNSRLYNRTTPYRRAGVTMANKCPSMPTVAGCPKHPSNKIECPSNNYYRPLHDSEASLPLSATHVLLVLQSTTDTDRPSLSANLKDSMKHRPGNSNSPPLDASEQAIITPRWREHVNKWPVPRIVLYELESLWMINYKIETGVNCSIPTFYWKDQ